ncbi:MAG: carboxylating nicotinate-nucleotide diphosphorylase [Planctomycetota bacterium]
MPDQTPAQPIRSLDVLGGATLPEAYARLASGGLARRLFELARDEDLSTPPRDLTAEVAVAPGEQRELAVIAREPGVLSGIACLPELCDVFAGPAGRIAFEPLALDGSALAPGQRVAVVRGPGRAVLGLERAMLNTLGRLSGIATRTAEFAALALGTPARVCDTRKTTPGLRVLEKYAVRCGGGVTHRLGLHDAVLLKDNHAAGDDLDAFAHRVLNACVRAGDVPASFVEVEVDTLAQLERVIALADNPGARLDAVLLDNFSVPELRSGVALRDERAPGVVLEASGGVSLETIAGIARTGVDRISVGSLTHGARSLDFGLDEPG